MASTTIVQVNVSVQTPPAPSVLQQTGALISVGATNTSPNTLTLLTQLSSLTSILNGALSVSGISQTSGTATVTTAAAHGLPISEPILITIAGASPAAYNGTFLCTPTTTTAFTYAVPSGTSSPATGTIVYTLEDVSELLSMATTFFAQGNATSVYVLELGPGSVTAAVGVLSAYLTANPYKLYAVLCPRPWDGNSALLTLIASYEAPTSQFYFFITTTLQTYSVYTSLMKCVRALIELPSIGTWSANAFTALSWSGGVVTGTTTTNHGVAVGQWFQTSGSTPTGYNGWAQAITGTTGTTLMWNLATNPGSETGLGTLVASYYPYSGIPSTEFSMASMFYNWVVNQPGAVNKVAPFQWRFLYGVTAFMQAGYSALLTTLDTANISVIGTGYQGGISTCVDWWGKFLDGNQCSYWYSVDWYQINIALNMSNAIINGSNNPVNPLYLNQAGINRVQAVGAMTASNGVSYGLGLGTVISTELTALQLQAALNAGTYAGYIVVNAVPFASYYAGNQSQYQSGVYNGYSIIYAPQVGFSSILVNLVVSAFQVA